MNSQIKLLAQEAGMYVDLNGNPWPKWMGAEECEQAYQKFAELIVRECADLADLAEPFTSSDLIKRHFGLDQ